MTGLKAGPLLLAALMQTALWWAVLRVDPFGMSSAADRASEEIFLRLYPILYPGTDEHIQVVLLNENQFPLRADGSKEWPLRYDEFADLIQKVVAQKPKGVFVDILFDTGEAEAAPLRDFIRQLPPDGPPVVLADYNDPGRKMFDVIRGLPFEGRGALRSVVELNVPPNHYPIATEGAPSPAAVLYNATVPAAEKLKLKANPEFLLAWGNTVDKVDASDPTCAAITAEDSNSRWNALASAVVAGLKGLVESPSSALHGEKSWERMQPCPYHPVLYAKQLYGGDIATSKARLRDAYVFIGADIAGSGDTVNSPVHGQLPGVFLHAMALDNLLAFHGPPFVECIGPALVQALLIFISAFGGALLFVERGPPHSRVDAAGGLAVSALAWVAYLLVIAAILLLFLQVFHWAPYNWGAVAVIAFAVFFAKAATDFFVILFGSK